MICHAEMNLHADCTSMNALTFVGFIIVILCFFFYFYNILYCVILHWYKEPFLVGFCKVYGIANTFKYIAPDVFCHVLPFSYFLFWLWHIWIFMFWPVRPSVWVFVKCCTLLYYFYFYICCYWNWFRLTNKYYLDLFFLCECCETTLVNLKSKCCGADNSALWSEHLL